MYRNQQLNLADRSTGPILSSPPSGIVETPAGARAILEQPTNRELAERQMTEELGALAWLLRASDHFARVALWGPWFLSDSQLI